MFDNASQSPSILSRYNQGDQRALGRLLTLVENGHAQSDKILEAVYPRANHAYRVGITGAPGAGKSTLVNRLTALAMHQGHSTAVLAMDPTSPYSGGALLGDRIRFEGPVPQAGQKPAFFRSAASRGHQGGLARATEEMSVLLDAFGYDRLLIETVGVGQVGLDIAQACDTTVVVVIPESGDDIQALKAGLLEIGDILVVNKNDRPGADTLMHDLEDALQYRQLAPRLGWKPAVLTTNGVSGEGLAALWEMVEKHHAHRLRQEGPEQIHQNRVRRIMLNLLREELHDALGKTLQNGFLPDGRPLEPLLEALSQGRENPFAVARNIIATLFRQGE